MNTFKCSLVIVIVMFFSLRAEAFQYAQLQIGSKAPMSDQKVTDVTGRNLTLREVAQENGLLVIFSCNTCPSILKLETRYAELSGITRSNKIGMVALNPNEDTRERGDGMEDMIKRARKAGYDFPYALDKNHVIADAFGATQTPYVYLFNGEMELVYSGAIDDNMNNASAVKNNYLKDAIDQMLKGEKVSNAKTKSMGCTIKRSS